MQKSHRRDIHRLINTYNTTNNKKLCGLVLVLKCLFDVRFFLIPIAIRFYLN